MQKKWIFWGVLGLLALLPLIYAATNATTLFVWTVSAGTRSYAITYGASCNATAFYFNEIDANVDPDSDGNAAKVPPTANLVSDTNTLQAQYTFGGIGSPSPGPFYAYQASGLNSDPTTLTEVATEFTGDEYINIETTGDSLYVDVYETAATDYFATQYQFDISTDRRRVKSFTLNYSGIAAQKVNGAPCIDDAEGREIEIRSYAWNWSTGAFDLLATHDDQQTGGVSTFALNPRTVVIDTNVINYINTTQSVVILLSAGPPSQVDGCMMMDSVDITIVSYPDTNVFCQTQTIAPIRIINNGTADFNVDGNFSSTFSGNDTNLVLKVWQGTGSGCGTNGFGGWEKDCSITNALTDLGMTTCRQFNQFNATSNGRLVTKLLVGDSNQLCFSGDINTFTRRGTYVKTFQIGDFNS